jgi:hypothetical membrane protein
MLALAFPVYFGSLDPAYDPARNFISELGDATAPHAWAVSCYLLVRSEHGASFPRG